jgi:Tfp pilus assembly protein PilN
VISVNFASGNYRVAARVVRGLIAGSVVLALVAAGLAWKAVSLRRDLTHMQASLHDAEAADLRLKPVLLEREQVVKDLGAMTGLLEARKFFWNRFLSSVESVVPVGVALKNVEFNPGKRTLTMQGTAQSPESLRNLVVGLEKSPSFANPLLKHQSLEKGSISFNVVAVYNEQ